MHKKIKKYFHFYPKAECFLFRNAKIILDKKRCLDFIQSTLCCGSDPPIRQHLAFPDIYTAARWSRLVHQEAMELLLINDVTTQGKQMRNMGQSGDFRCPRPY